MFIHFFDSNFTCHICMLLNFYTADCCCSSKCATVYASQLVFFFGFFVLWFFAPLATKLPNTHTHSFSLSHFPLFSSVASVYASLDLSFLCLQQFNRVNTKVTKKPYNKNPYVACISMAVANFLTLKWAQWKYREFHRVLYATMCMQANDFNETIRLWLWC